MYARAVEDAARDLRDLRHDEWGDFGLGVLAFGLAAAATELRPAWALPLLIGGMTVWALGVRAMWRHWDLVDRLAGDRDAYVISDVLAHASREATINRRRTFAAMIRGTMRQPGVVLEPRVGAAADELEALAEELEDEELVLDPACAVACMRLLTDSPGSPLLNPALPASDLRSCVVLIRSGFTPRGRVSACVEPINKEA
jgi:hypothetical protein